MTMQTAAYHERVHPTTGLVLGSAKKSLLDVYTPTIREGIGHSARQHWIYNLSSHLQKYVA